jgi:hypothetical protein
MRNNQQQRDYPGVPEAIGEHYWHEEGVKGYWSIIKPFNETLVNACKNPSFEVDLTHWVAINTATVTRLDDAALHGSMGARVVTTAAGQGIGYEFFDQFAFGVDYSAAISVNGPAGAGVTFKFEHDIVIPSATTVILPGYPIRITCQLPATIIGTTLPTLPVSVRFDTTGTYYVDGLVIMSRRTPVELYFDGDSPGGSWFGAPHDSSSGIDIYSRTFGERVNLNEIGFSVTGQSGFGMAPRNLITSSFARQNGAHLQRVKDDPRVITITGQFECGPEEMHEARAALVEALMWRFKNQYTTELLLTYTLRDECGNQLTPEVSIPVEYQSGLEGIWNTLDRERVVLTFVANTDQAFTEMFDRSVEISGTTIVTNQGNEDAWVEVLMFASAGGLRVEALHNDTTGHHVYFGTTLGGGNPTDLPLTNSTTLKEYAILRTDPAKRISLDLYRATYEPDPPNDFLTVTQTRIMHYIRYPESQVGMFRLVPGDNAIRVELEAVSGLLYIKWRNRWLSTDSLYGGA